jgi:3-keto-disaccharide hydrolase
VLAVGLSIEAPAGVGATSTSSATGQALFTANWKSGVAGWQVGGGRWHISGGLLTNTIDDPSSLLAPYRLTRANFAVQATIRLAAWRHSGSSEDNVFGILFRGAGQGAANPATGLVGGVARGFLGCDGLYSWAGIATADTDSEVLKETSKFRPEHGWHTYRLEVRGNAMRLLVDGKLRNAVTSKRFAGQKAVGLYALAATIQVRNFTVIGL